MKLRKLFIVGLLAVAFTTVANAQNYNTGIGARLGYDNGLTVKHFIGGGNAIEGILSVSPNYFNVTALYEYQRPIPNAQNLDWYLGIGGHVGAIHKNKEAYDNSMIVGADFIAGMEYKFPTVPFAVSLDWKPSVNFTNNYNDFWYAGFALSLRYAF